MSTFAKYGERGKNTSLMKGTPILPDSDAIPSLPGLPEFGVEYRARRAQESVENLYECDYEILPPHDINGVGLLYFAAYPSVFDLCFERSEGKGFLLEPQHRLQGHVLFRQLGANGDVALSSPFSRRRKRCDPPYRVLYRTSDGKRMAEVSSVKRRMN